mmetsp:Transcript_28948/g.83634  ORF Transcript_28948/g.83634 Transcript_28948/m.83634 type:complete len:407 (+) Transcript_28948:213-1433(+)
MAALSMTAGGSTGTTVCCRTGSRRSPTYTDTSVGTNHTPPADIHAPFYPLLGPYSSRDANLLSQHMDWLVGIGADALVLSWHGIHGGADGEGVRTHRNLNHFVRALERKIEEWAARKRVPVGDFDPPLKVIFHMEPYRGRNITSVQYDMQFIVRTFNDTRWLYRDPITRLPWFYLYDSYHIKPALWQQVLCPEADGPGCVRGSDIDGVFMGLCLDGSSLIDAARAGFDGCYSYFASDGFTPASTTSRWPWFQQEACSQGRGMGTKRPFQFIPCVGPGYDDTKIRPWNKATTRQRKNGAYFAQMWDAAQLLQEEPPLDCKGQLPVAGLTSFNEWGEGSQIEPAVEREGYHTYPSDERPGRKGDPYFFLKASREYIDRWKGPGGEAARREWREEWDDGKGVRPPDQEL